MTCVIGLIHNGDVYIGADSAGTAGLSRTIRLDEKVFGNGPFIIGGTTSFRMLQLLRYKFSPPAQTIHQNDMEYMVSSFIDACRNCFAVNGFGDKDATSGGTFLVGYKSKLYCIQSDYQVGVSQGNFDAVGCGADLALGAMYASEGLAPDKRIEMALSAAAFFNAGVAAPYNILCLENETKAQSKTKPKSKKPIKKKATK